MSETYYNSKLSKGQHASKAKEGPVVEELQVLAVPSELEGIPAQEAEWWKPL